METCVRFCVARQSKRDVPALQVNFVYSSVCTCVYAASFLNYRIIVSILHPLLLSRNFGCIWKFSSLYLFSRNDILFYQSFVLWFFYYLISNKYCYNSNTHIHIYIWSKYAILNVRVTVITQTHTHIYTIQICNLKYWKETNWSLAKISPHFIFKYKEKREEKNNFFSHFHRFPSRVEKKRKEGIEIPTSFASSSGFENSEYGIRTTVLTGR